MKKIDLSNIVQNVRGMRLERATLQHMLDSYSECFEALLNALKCDPDEITILTGAQAVQVGSDYTVTAGWVAYQHEVFQVAPNAFTSPPGEVGVWVLETTYASTDPVKFDDGNEFNVNQIRKMKLQSGVSGSGVKDWDEGIKYEITLDRMGTASVGRAQVFNSEIAITEHIDVSDLHDFEGTGIFTTTGNSSVTNQPESLTATTYFVISAKSPIFWQVAVSKNTGKIYMRQTVSTSWSLIADPNDVHLQERSTLPADPSEGQSIIYQSDGSFGGGDGDIMMKITAGGVTKTVTLVDFSAI